MMAESNDVESTVDRYLQDDPFLNGLGARVIPGTARQEQWGWSIAVGTSSEPDRRFEMYDHMTEIEERLREHEKLDVIIAPSGSNPNAYTTPDDNRPNAEHNRNG